MSDTVILGLAGCLASVAIVMLFTWLLRSISFKTLKASIKVTHFVEGSVEIDGVTKPKGPTPEPGWPLGVATSPFPSPGRGTDQ